MEIVQVLFNRTHPDAKLPTKGYAGDNCYDLYCVEETVIPARSHGIVPVGLKVAFISDGYGLAIKTRSGLGFKHSLMCHGGEIDGNYKGSLDIKIYSLGDKDYIVQKGERIAQFKVEKVWDSFVAITDEKFESNRGENGFGSSGK